MDWMLTFAIMGWLLSAVALTEARYWHERAVRAEAQARMSSEYARMGLKFVGKLKPRRFPIEDDDCA